MPTRIALNHWGTPFPRCLHGGGNYNVESVVLRVHGLWEGVFFEWATTDSVFKVNMSTSGAPFRERPGITSHIMFPLNGNFELM